MRLLHMFMKNLAAAALKSRKALAKNRIDKSRGNRQEARGDVLNPLLETYAIDDFIANIGRLSP